MIEERSVIVKEGAQHVCDLRFSESGRFLKVANELSAEQPEIVDVLLDGSFREAGLGKVKKERCKALHQLLAGEEIAVVAHPA